jgi:hypothetical protein
MRGPTGHRGSVHHTVGWCAVPLGYPYAVCFALYFPPLPLRCIDPLGELPFTCCVDSVAADTIHAVADAQWSHRSHGRLPTVVHGGAAPSV